MVIKSVSLQDYIQYVISEADIVCLCGDFVLPEVSPSGTVSQSAWYCSPEAY